MSLFKRKKDISQEPAGLLKEDFLEWAGRLTEELADMKSQLIKSESSQEETGKLLRRQTETINDFLDEMQEEREEEEEKGTALKAASDREKKLCELIGIYEEQLHLLEEQLVSSDGWKDQICLMRQKRKQAGKLAQLQETGEEGEPFDYLLHEAVETADTEEEKQDSCIAKVYTPGFVYQGKVMRKAKVVVYRRRKG